MFRVLVFGAAALTVFVGIVTVFPLLDSEIDSGVSAAVASVGASVPGETFEDDSSKEETTRHLSEKSLIRPSCMISANPAVISRGERVSIAWDSENAASARLSDVGAVLPHGGLFMRPSRSGAYMLVVHSTDGEIALCSTSIIVR